MRLPRLYTIRTALVVFALCPFLLISILSGWFGLHRLETETLTTMEEEIQLIARSIRLPLSHALEHGHTGTLRRTVTSAYDMDQVYGVYVYDRDGQRISSSGSRDAPMRGTQAADLASRGDERAGFEEVGGEEVFSYFMPLTDSGGRIIGLLQVTRRGSDFAQQLEQFRLRALSLMTISALLALALIWVGYHFAVGRHVLGIRQDMQRIAGGDLGHRVEQKGPEEIRFLGREVNTMLDGIAASERELEKRRQEQQKLKTRLHENEKLAAIGRFAAGVAHELGTPLSVADGKAQRALRHTDGKTSEPLQQIRQQLRRMERIIRQLMNFARPVTPEQRPVKPGEIVSSCLAQVEEERTRLGGTITWDNFGDTPTLSADRLRLEQALINLLRNALQANPGGRVHLGWNHTAPGWLTLSVEDDGPGVPPDIQPRLLEPFFTTKAVGAGTGLGLAVVDAVVHEHQGRIEIGHSDRFGGAAFTIHLPLPEPGQTALNPSARDSSRAERAPQEDSAA